MERDKSVKLHLGCGNTPIKGFINVDILKIPGVDVICDLKDLGCFSDNSVDVIYASHFFEHFGTEEIPIIFKEMYRVIKENGEIRLSVPDLDKICQLYVKNIDWFTPPNNPWLGLIYGGQANQYDFHKTGFNYRWLKYLLQKAGFSEVEEVDNFQVHGVRDGSFANMPFGKISLNVIAYKSKKIDVSQIDTFKESLLERFFSKLELLLYLLVKAVVEVKLRLIGRRLKKL